MEYFLELKTLANLGRKSFMGVLQNSGINSTKGTCLFSCDLLKKIIEKYATFDVVVIVRGGDGKNDGGYTDKLNQSHGHYWLEVATPNQTYIVDITADQFPKGEEVTVLLINKADQYKNGCQRTVDEGFLEISSRN